jgi:hypothetical protein
MRDEIRLMEEEQLEVRSLTLVSIKIEESNDEEIPGSKHPGGFIITD